MAAKKSTPGKPASTRPRASKKAAGKKLAVPAQKTRQPSRRKTAPAPPKPRAKRPPAQKHADVPVAAVGASAGGLEALTLLLRALPPDTGLAYVLIQHLDPHHPSQLTELLARATRMPVVEVKDGLRLEPNRVYVIAPNTRLALADGALKLTPRAESKPEPIDYFFQSLAHSRGRRAIGVLLSGTGSDGTQGLEAIKAGDGLTFAQSPETAQFDTMPRSAIIAGVVDHVLPPAGIAEELARLGQHPYLNHAPWPAAKPGQPSNQADNEAAHQAILALLRDATGVDLSTYKQSTLRRRIHRRMALGARPNTLEDYLAYLNQNPTEVIELYHDIFIHVASFFREAETYEVLQRKVFPTLVKNRPPGSPVRLWVAGCSTGEEAYSLAIAWLEFAEGKPHAIPVQIFATDISAAAIEKARAGRYRENIEGAVSPARLRHFFVKTPGGYQIGKAVRDLVVFAPHNLLHDPPFTQLDLVSCCNVLIYMEPGAQKSLIPLFHYALKPGGFLVLGKSETVGRAADLFNPLDRKNRVYTRRVAAGRSLHALLPASGAAWPVRASAVQPASQARRGAEASLWEVGQEADRVALARYAPASVIISDDLQIVQIRGHVGPYLEPAAGDPSYNLRQMARSGLETALPGLVHKARRAQAPARLEGLRVKHNGHDRPVNVEVVPLLAGAEAQAAFYLVLFEDAVRPAPAEPQVARPARAALGKGRGAERQAARLEAALEEAQENLREATAEREADHEELTAALEELQSGNEELQSTNEELQTAKEELQSANEEMSTLNEELEIRNREVNQALSDLSNITDSVLVPMVMVSGDLRLRYFTPTVNRVLNVVATDLGRPITEIKTRLDLPDLGRLITQVIDSLSLHEQEVRDEAGHWHLMRLRPYKTVDNKLDGAVITWLDITDLKTSLAQVAEARNYSAAIVETVRMPLLVLDGDMRVQTANQAFYQMFKGTPEATGNHLLYDLGDGQWNIPRLRELLEQVLPRRQRLNDFEVEHAFPGIGLKIVRLNARRIAGDENRAALILLAIEDVTEQRRYQENQRVLAEMSAELSLSENDTQRLPRLLQLLVPYLADWCLLELLATDASPAQFAEAHADPARLPLVRTLARRYGGDGSTKEALRSSQPQAYPDLPASLLETMAQDADHLGLLRELELRSMLIIPVINAGQPLGVLTLARTAPERAYTAADVDLAQGLAVRMALAITNARQYRAAQHLTTELEARVLERTGELEAVNVQLTNEAAERERVSEALARSHADFRALAVHQQEVRELERTRMSQDIHDELGAELTGFKMDLAVARQILRDAPQPAQDRLRDLSSHVDQLMNLVRRIAGELRPPLLDDLGLLAAVEWQAQEFQKRSGVRCQLTTKLTHIPLDPASAIAVFRVFQEILTNVARHAQATRVEVTLAEQDARLVLQVSDNGQGISASEVNNPRSLGIMGMRERLAALDGALDITSAPGQGATVTVSMPLAAPADGRSNQ